MTRSISSFLAAGLLALCGAAGAVEPGQPAPAFTLPGSDGQVGLGALQGQVVLLDFWASWCGPCKLSFPWMNEMQAKYGPRGLRVVAVNLDRQRAAADSFLRQAPARFTLAFDAAGELPKLYAVKAMPTSVLIGADGRVIQQHAGFRDDDRPALEAAIVAALGPAR